MSPKNFPWQAWIAIACIVAFIPYFFRENIIGTDSYNTLLLFPLPFWAIKTILLACTITACISIGWLARKILEEKAWIAGLLPWASPIFAQFFWNYENETIGFTIACIAIALWFSEKQKSFWHSENKQLAIGLAIISALFWQANLLVLLSFSLGYLVSFVLLTATFLLLFWNKIGAFIPTTAVQENFPGFGLLFQGGLLLGLMEIKKCKTIALPALFFLALGFLNQRFAVFAIPFMAVLSAGFFLNKKNGLIRYCVLIMTVIVFLQTPFWSFSLPPTSQELLATELAIEMAGGETIYNSWGTGYWIDYYGGKAFAHAGGVWDLNCTNCIVLDYFEHDCGLPINYNPKEDYGTLDFLPLLKVYKC